MKSGVIILQHVLIDLINLVLEKQLKNVAKFAVTRRHFRPTFKNRYQIIKSMKMNEIYYSDTPTPADYKNLLFKVALSKQCCQIGHI